MALSLPVTPSWAVNVAIDGSVDADYFDMVTLELQLRMGFTIAGFFFSHLIWFAREVP
jgi:hypothetical protein